MTARLPIRRLLLTVTAMSAAAIGAPALGAQAPDTTAAEPDTVFAVEPLVVTASRLPVAPTRLGVALDRVEPTPWSSPYARDVVRRAPGAFLDEAAGPGGPTIVRLRGGEEVFTQILFDGVQVNQNGGFFDFLGLSLSNLERVEVARGPQSAVYGSSAVSGVVNFITPRGHVGDPEVTLRGEGGAATEHGGSWRGTATVRGGTPSLRYSAGVGAAFRRGIYALPHDAETRDASLRLDWLPTASWAATFTGRRVDVASNLPVRDPGASRVPLDPNAFNERDRTVGSFTLRHAPAGPWSGYARVSHYRESFLYRDERDDVMVPEGSDFFVFDASFRFTSDLERTTAEVGGSLEGEAAGASWGVLWERETLEDRTTGDFESGPLRLERDAVAGFGEVVLEPAPGLTLAGGVRLEKYEDIDLEATPRASMAWHPGEAPVTLRAVVGKAYKAPNLQQQYVDNPFIVANPDLRPERSTSVEAGVDVGGVERGWTAGVTVFRQRYDDLIRTVGVEGEDVQTNRNLGASVARGVEWQGALRLAGGPWWLESDGAWIDTEILDNQGLSGAEFPEGEALPFRPSVVGSLSLAWRGEGPVTGRLTARRVGSQTVLSERFSGQRVELDGYTLVELSADYAVTRDLRVYLRTDNLLDQGYQTAFDRPGAPAQGAVGFEVVF